MFILFSVPKGSSKYYFNLTHQVLDDPEGAVVEGDAPLACFIAHGPQNACLIPVTLSEHCLVYVPNTKAAISTTEC